MRIVFSTSHFGFLRNFESTLRALAARGHHLHLLADRKDTLGGMRTIERLVGDHPSITFGFGPNFKDGRWSALGAGLRLSQDYWRYLHPRYDDAPKLRARAAAQAPAVSVLMTRLPGLRASICLRALRAAFGTLDRAIPPSDEVVALLRNLQPDLLLVTPLLYFASQQLDYVRAARLLGIPSALGVGSWDHLTTKGLIHEIPDRVFVWNEPQRQEAWEIHGVPPERVVVTGAQAFDHWFVSSPSTSRAEFCDRLGLPRDAPIVLYLCSSPFITPREVEFVKGWIEAIRTSAHPTVRGAGILVRPHPQNAEQWKDVDLSHRGAVIHPRQGANPVDSVARAEYFDSMYHSAVVVGVNTSALIESGIVGRCVCTIVSKDFESTQEGTLHFRHLKNVNGGLLHVAHSFDEHLTQLESVLTAGSGTDERSRRFVEAFVRPGGIAQPAAELFADGVESMGRTCQRAPAAPTVVTRTLRAGLYLFAVAAQAAARRAREATRRNARSTHPTPADAGRVAAGDAP